MPVLETKGAASAQGFGLTLGGAAPVYIEDVFSTWLIKPPADFTNYSINNGIDLLGKGGMTWFKARNAGSTNNLVYDTVRGSSAGNANALITNFTGAQQTTFFDFVTPNSNGFTVNFASGGGQLTNSGINYASWTFRKAPKFFDVVTYTGTGSPQNIAHSLGSVPGCIMVKRTDATGSWLVYHQNLLNTSYALLLDSTTGQIGSSTFWNNTAPTSTVFTVGNNTDVNANGGTYVAYVFAHNAGGFGLTGTDNVISCGSYTDGAGVSVNLGYEPQWLLVKAASAASGWVLMDTMRGMNMTNDSYLQAQVSDAEGTFATAYWQPTATGFYMPAYAVSPGTTMIYIAIRRGPMKVPTDGTEVFTPQATRTASNGTPSQNSFTSNFPMDMMIQGFRDGDGATAAQFTLDRLRGSSPWLATTTTGTENANTTYSFASQTGIYPTTSLGATNMCGWMFRRAPGFFDEVCYTGNGGSGTRAIDHNLRVPPELLIVKSRSNSATEWVVGNTVTSWPNRLALNNTTASSASDIFSDTPPSSLVFNVRRASGDVNETGWTFVAYLFASCPGVSKVGSYTGTGATQVINCGFTGGARFVLIKATSTTGNWLVWDSARGIVAGNDPYLALNSTAAEVTNTDWVDTAASGFELSNAGGNLANSNGVSYIYLAIA